MISRPNFLLSSLSPWCLPVRATKVSASPINPTLKVPFFRTSPTPPTIQITEAIISVAQRPVFVGVGGGTTAGKRVESIALDAELHGATAVVLNAPTTTEFVQNLVDDIDIPVVLTIVSLNEDLEKRMLHTKANIINVSGGKDTVKIVKKLREIDPNFPIIATGGPTEETVREVIQAGANAVTFTPPTNGEIFKGMMEEYRHRYD